MFAKRAFDMALSGTMLLALSPIFILTAVLIKLTTPKLPVFYPWKVVGYKGRTFTGYKFTTMDADHHPSQPLRTLFLQELVRNGVLGPSLVVSYSHSDDDIDRTIEALDNAMGVYAKALAHGTDGLLIGEPSRTVFDRKWR